MPAFLVCYGTGEGQTARVADRVASALRARGHDAEAVDLGESAPDRPIEEYDAVVVGSSVHGGRQQSAVVEFVREHRDALAGLPTGFFQVSLSSATDDEERRARAAGYVAAFEEETGWHPDRVALLGGALRYTEYGFLMRLVMRQIAKRGDFDTDTSRDHEYTDWEEVERFANDFSAFVEGRLGVVPPTADTP